MLPKIIVEVIILFHAGHRSRLSNRWIPDRIFSHLENNGRPEFVVIGGLARLFGVLRYLRLAQVIHRCIQIVTVLLVPWRIDR